MTSVVIRLSLTKMKGRKPLSDKSCDLFVYYSNSIDNLSLYIITEIFSNFLNVFFTLYTISYFQFKSS